MIERVLIANRGEIAIRIARSVHDLGLGSVGIFEPGERSAEHVKHVDTAIEVPSYLDLDEVLAAAVRSEATLLHPGYGFLSENAGFARLVEESGVGWIGPPAEAIELMGDKARAKVAARTAGMPTIPGVEGHDVALEEIRAFCSEAGFPAVIKAVAGGGGKGMRVVRTHAEIAPAYDAARREAQAAFGDARVLVERYIERPRHIEIQVLADQHGNCIHLGERECSLQRRHQKVIEEAPSAVVDSELRGRMGEAAVALTRACGYVGAGTIELIVPPDLSDFFFLEMNTRLQVEHPVTELVYGIDLVEEQVRIARGEALTLDQQAVRPSGHAVEARLYAEDASNHFLPAGGLVRRYKEPRGAGVRVDSGIAAGVEIGTSYDPMIAKVIAAGRDRPEALGRLDRALKDFVILGVPTNAAFSRRLLRSTEVMTGALDTGLLERRLVTDSHSTPPHLVLAAAVGVWLDDLAEKTISGPWLRSFEELGDFRIADGAVSNGETRSCFSVVDVSNGRFKLTLDGTARTYESHVGRDAVWIFCDGDHLEVRFAKPERRAAGPAAGSLEAPMPGVVLSVLVANGDEVSEGDVLVVVESMKMELSVVAPAAGRVTDLTLGPGDRVTRGQSLLRVEQ